ncbi:MAG: PAS domain-containing protein [Polyangiaceae bacterium]
MAIALGEDTQIHQAPRSIRSESENLLENFGRLVPGVIYQYRLYPDGSSAFPWSSPGMSMIYEVTPEEVREDATPVFGRIHPDDYATVGEAIFESARTLQTFYAEFRVILPVQGLRWRWSQAQPERMADGSTLWHGIIIDVTARKLAEEQSERLQAQLQQAMKMEAIGRLAGGIAHDFNNLLTAIIGNASLASHELHSKELVLESLIEIGRAAESAAALTRQLLAFSRKQLIEPKVLDPNVLIRSLRKMLSRLIGENIELATTLDPNLGAIKIESGTIRTKFSSIWR